jgi:hypothetical protein
MVWESAILYSLPPIWTGARKTKLAENHGEQMREAPGNRNSKRVSMIMHGDHVVTWNHESDNIN